MSLEEVNMSSRYYPLLKSTVSELRALKLLDEDDLVRTTPIFELTKSRKSKNNPGCDVYKKVDEILEIVGDLEFILDITNEESLTNDQIESFFDDSNAFYNWTDFVRRIRTEKKANVVPMVLAYDDSEKDTLMLQARRLLKYCSRVCIRIPVELVGDEIVETLIEVAAELEDVLIIVDLGYVRDDTNLGVKMQDGAELLRDVLAIDDSLETVMLASSFPASVVSVVPNKEKMSSSFKMYTYQIYQYLLKTDPDLQYGDYACIHPYRGEARPMIWIPRIDYPYDSKVLFERCRREDGGYEVCASNIVADPNYSKNRIDCWGCNEIDDAANGILNGKSPSYWISVRSNIHMTRMVRG
ncbi:beta family protein [Vibrio parahaemolyticus]|uniref:beta family protein n=2 Tax=Vibrio TaxID=662 RepID=UPI0009A9EE76|nr:beta family protein [Vibrio parahaemolyticus]MDS1924679.1 beta family protein [Vibrio parahaemolyticus]